MIEQEVLSACQISSFLLFKDRAGVCSPAVAGDVRSLVVFCRAVLVHLRTLFFIYANCTGTTTQWPPVSLQGIDILAILLHSAHRNLTGAVSVSNQLPHSCPLPGICCQLPFQPPHSQCFPYLEQVSHRAGIQWCGRHFTLCDLFM